MSQTAISDTPRATAGLARLGLLASLLCSAAPPPAVAEAPAPPSVILIIVDTLRADALGCYGQTADTSPELDRYAAQGVRFARVVAQSTWTRPSIGSLLTSLHPRSLGIFRERGEALSEAATTLAERFDAAGYFTVGATANPNLNRSFRFDQGFDEYFDSQILFPFMQGADDPALGRDDAAPALPRASDLFAHARDALSRRPADTPVFLQLTLMEIHEARKLDPPLRGPRFAALARQAPSLDTALYWKAVSLLSRRIDRFIDELLSLPGFERSLVVITSDHGETLGEEHSSLADPKWHGHLVYETQTLVPWILWANYDGLPRGRVVRRPVRLLELMPTVLELVGLPVPSDLAGRSLAPLLRSQGAAPALPEAFAVETEFRSVRKRALYSGDWIYVENRDGQAGTAGRELQRAGQTSDGSATSVLSSHEATADRMRRTLEQWSRDHPRAEPTPTRGEDPATLEQLRALGYVE